jgi:hypothetical protein
VFGRFVSLRAVMPGRCLEPGDLASYPMFGRNLSGAKQRVEKSG